MTKDEYRLDGRENARYGSSVWSEEVAGQYAHMDNICKQALSKCEEIVFSTADFTIPEELRDQKELL